MKAIVNGIILLPDREVRDCALLYDERIIGITREARVDEVIDAGGAYVSPGLIDTHIHGYTGHEATDATREALCSIAHGLLQDGVTAFLPTAGANAWPVLQKTFEQTRALMGESSSAAFPGAEILGCHSEGPFINPSKKGAMNEKYIQPLDAGKILPYADVIRVLTFAPELPGGAEFIRTLKEKTDIALSMGHTNATFEQAIEAVGLGVTRVTHLFNAMSPLHHREPGVAGAALTADVYTELIADTFHVDKGLFPLIIRAKGNHLILITDTGRHIGLPDGEYEEDGTIVILKGKEARLPDGTIAGSVLHLNQGVKNLRDWGHLPMYAAVRCASLNVACSIGMEKRKGSLAAGKDADIVLMDRDCQILRTISHGETKYIRGN